MNYATDIITEAWVTDGDTSAKVRRISNTGAANTAYIIENPLGRIPVGVELIKKNKACDVYVDSLTTIQTLVLKFSVASADVNIRVW